MTKIILNDFVVDLRLANLMQRDDWVGKRTSSSWLEKFPVINIDYQIPFVEFCGLEQLILENKGLRNPDNSMLWGKKSLKHTPGDFDPYNGYLIGFTEYCDDGIYVDLRDKDNPIITYTSGNPDTYIVTAFNSITSFVNFYLSQH